MAITIPILTDFNGSGIDRGVAQFKRLESTGARAQFLLRKAALPAAAALGAVAVGAKVAVGAASDMNETLSKTEVLFGGSADTIKKWSTTTATSFGIGRQEALDAATTFATFGKAAGLTGGDLSKFSTDFTGLAGDLASFNNTTPEQAIQAIGAALRGESEPLRSYGVLLDDASMRQEAVRLGLIKTTKEALTPQNKVLAAQALIYKQTKDAQGDFSRTSDSAANRQKILKARMDDLTASLGQALLPVVETVTGLLAKLAGWFNNNQRVAKVLIGTVAALSAGILILTVAAKAFAVILAVISLSPVVLIIGAIVAAVAALTIGFVALYKKSETFRKIVTEAFEGAKKVIGKVVDFLKGPVLAAWEVIQGVLEVIKGLIAGDFSRVWEGIKTTIGGVLDGIKSAILGVPQLIGGAVLEIGKTIVTKIAEGIVDLATKVWDKLKGLPRALLNLAVGWTGDLRTLGGRVITYMARGITGLASAAWDNIKGFAKVLADKFTLENIGETLKGIGSAIIDFIIDGFQTAASGVVSGLKGIINKAIDLVNGGIRKVNSLSGKINAILPGNPIGEIKPIPRLAKGGIVRSPTLALIGEAGPEAVVPLSGRNAGMGMTINVQAGLISTPDQIGQQIIEAIQRAQRRSGPAFVSA